MGKYWDWYQVEFQAVAKRLPAKRREDILEALREHVQEATEELTSSGLTREQAEQQAIKNLGAPLAIVRAETDSPSRQWWPVWVATICLLWCGFWLTRGDITWTMPMLIPVLYATPVMVLIASIFGKRLKLWALFGTTVATCMATLVAVSLTWLHFGSAGGIGMSPVWDVAKYRNQMDRQIQAIRLDVNHLELATAAFARGDRVEAKVLAYSEKGWSVPSGYFYSYSGHVAYEHVPTFELAVRQWGKYGKRSASIVNAELDKQTTYRGALDSPKAYNPLVVFKETLYPMLCIMFSVFGILAAAHLIGFAIAAWPLHQAKRRWRLVL